MKIVRVLSQSDNFRQNGLLSPVGAEFLGQMLQNARRSLANGVH